MNIRAIWKRYGYYSLVAIGLFVSALLLLSFIAPFISAMSPLWKESRTSFQIDFFHLARTALYTLEVAFGSMLIALVIGLPIAFFCAKRNFFGKRLLLSLSAIPLCMPPLLIAIGFVLVFGMQGSANKLLRTLFNLEESPLQFLYSFWGIIIAQGFYNFPLIMKTVSDTWKKLPKDQSDVARLLGASEKRIFFTVTLQQLLPSIISSSVLVFLYCFFSFLIVLLFGVVGSTTLEVAVYQAARTSLNFKQAAVLALAETGIAITLVFIWTNLEHNSKKLTGLMYGQEESPIPLKKNERPFFIILIAIITVFFIAPLLSIVFKAFSGPHFFAIFEKKSFWTSIYNTVTIGLLSASLSTIGASCFALIIKSIDPYAKHSSLRIIPLIPMAVSSVVMGFGLTMLFSRSTPLFLAVVQAALAWPFAFKQINASLDKIPYSTLEASKILSQHKFESIFRVQLPMCKHSIISAFGFCFAISCGDAVLPLVLAIPRFDTLALFTYRLAGAYRFNEACASGLILLALTAGIFYWNKKYEVL